MTQGGPITDSLKRHTEATAEVRAAKPSSFTVGAFTDGTWHRAEVTYDYKWSNAWGLTAYARAWWNDAPVTPNRSKLGGEAGVQARYEFTPPTS